MKSCQGKKNKNLNMREKGDFLHSDVIGGGGKGRRGKALFI